MVRAFILFAAGAALVLGTGWFARSVLHLDCIGPFIEGWGCLNAPYPAALPGNSTLLFDLGVAVVGFLVCLVLKDVAWSAASRLAALAFPAWARRAAQEPTRTYRIR